MVLSEKIFSPQEFVLRITGDCYIFTGDNDVVAIENILGEDFRNYSLSEIDIISENKLNVVLVDCLIYNGNEVNTLRWFEVPEEKASVFYTGFFIYI